MTIASVSDFQPKKRRNKFDRHLLRRAQDTYRKLTIANKWKSELFAKMADD